MMEVQAGAKPENVILVDLSKDSKEGYERVACGPEEDLYVSADGTRFIAEQRESMILIGGKWGPLTEDYDYIRAGFTSPVVIRLGGPHDPRLGLLVTQRELSREQALAWCVESWIPEVFEAEFKRALDLLGGHPNLKVMNDA